MYQSKSKIFENKNIRKKILENAFIFRIKSFILECSTSYSGRPNVFFPGNSKPHEVFEMVTNNKFLDNCSTATNAHGKKKDEEFTKIFQ